ncbi:vWA domain-containing protein [Butyrivibrio sp. MC2021]|uniref:vWA domain-containing protein n=1 Tax=Butyrivibrio sp. MC2021 TaxID=1408306 RepID=UPI00047EF8C8|nr:VWA domain-containing protein [Butyrivibrio sp. MC2021]
MSKGYTEIVYILDRSGSMGGLEADTIGGFNSMMEKQKKTGEKALVSTVLFDDECEVIHDRVPIEKIEKMTDKQYYVRGCTALLDAVGGAIHHIGNIHKYAREEDRPEKTIFVITTDGMENASRIYSRDKIEKMVKKQQKKYGWEFIFIGANIDAYAEAKKYGIRKDRTVNYVSDGIGTGIVYEGVSKAVCSVMMAGSARDVDKDLGGSGWDMDIDADFQRRGRKVRR